MCICQSQSPNLSLLTFSSPVTISFCTLDSISVHYVFFDVLLLLFIILFSTAKLPNGPISYALKMLVAKRCTMKVSRTPLPAACQVASVVSDSVRPHGLQPTRLLCPWDSPGKNTGVGCHFLLQCMKVESESEVTQSCLTLSDPMDCSPPGSFIHGIFWATVLEWGAIAFSPRTPQTP